MIDDDEIRKDRSYKKMLSFFNGNEDKLFIWYHTGNQMLHRGLSPLDLLEAGMSDELSKWVDDHLGDSW